MANKVAIFSKCFRKIHRNLDDIGNSLIAQFDKKKLQGKTLKFGWNRKYNCTKNYSTIYLNDYFIKIHRNLDEIENKDNKLQLWLQEVGRGWGRRCCTFPMIGLQQIVVFQRWLQMREKERCFLKFYNNLWIHDEN